MTVSITYEHSPFYLTKRSVSLSVVSLCDPTDCSRRGYSVHGILLARILGIAIPFSRGSSRPRDQTQVSCTAAAAKSLQSCPTLSDATFQSCATLSDSMDCSLPGSSVHGIFQAKALEWGAIAFSVIVYYNSMIYHTQSIFTSSNTESIFKYLQLFRKKFFF